GSDRCRHDACLRESAECRIFAARRKSAARVNYDLNVKSACGAREGGVLDNNLGGDARNKESLSTSLRNRIACRGVQEGISGRSDVLRQIAECGADLRSNARCSFFGWRSRHDHRNVKELCELRERGNGSAQTRKLVGPSSLDDARLQIGEKDDGIRGIKRCIVHGFLSSNR